MASVGDSKTMLLVIPEKYNAMRLALVLKSIGFGSTRSGILRYGNAAYAFRMSIGEVAILMDDLEELEGKRRGSNSALLLGLKRCSNRVFRLFRATSPWKAWPLTSCHSLQRAAGDPLENCCTCWWHKLLDPYM